MRWTIDKHRRDIEKLKRKIDLEALRARKQQLWIVLERTLND